MKLADVALYISLTRFKYPRAIHYIAVSCTVVTFVYPTRSAFKRRDRRFLHGGDTKEELCTAPKNDGTLYKIYSRLRISCLNRSKDACVS